MKLEHFAECKNNRNYLSDTTFAQARQADLYTQLKTPTPNIEQCGTTYFKCNKKHFAICGIGDLHTDEMVYDRWNLVKNYCHDTNLALCYLGDLATVSINNYDNSQPQESRFNVEDEVALTSLEVAFNAHKTLGAVGGNHGEPQQGDRLKNIYFSVERAIMQANGIAYSPNAMLYVIDMPVYKGNKFLYYKPVHILTLHGRGRTPSERIASANKIYQQGMGVIRAYNLIHHTNIVPDIILGGHFHGNSSCDFSVECNITNKEGKVTGSYIKTVRVRECSTFASKTSSSFNNSFADSIVQNLNVLDFRYIHNDSFNPNGTNDHAEDILEILEFPILKRNSCELTLPAQIYQRHNEDFDLVEQERIRLADKTVEELTSLL